MHGRRPGDSRQSPLPPWGKPAAPSGGAPNAGTAWPIGHVALVLHPFMLDWLGEERFAAILDRLAEGRRRAELWPAPCGEVADHLLADPEAAGEGFSLSAP